MDFRKIGLTFLDGCKKHSPEILIGVGVGGFFTSIVLAIKATPKACELMEEYKLDTGKDEMTKKEVVATTWKCYIPTVITAGCSAACVVGGTRTGLKRNAALAAAYKISQESLELYREKVIETIGEKKEKAVRDQVAQEQYERRDKQQQVIITNRGEMNCYDLMTKKAFKSDVNIIEKAVNQVNGVISNEMSADYNEFLERVGLPYFESFSDIGWQIEDFPIEVKFTYGPDDSGAPCLIVDWYNEPHYIGR